MQQNSALTFSYYRELVDLTYFNNLIQKNFDNSKKDTKYFDALYRYIMDEPLSSRDKEDLGESAHLFIDPTKLYPELEKSATYAWETMRRICPASDSVVQIHGCKVFIKVTFLQLTVKYMRQYGFRELGSGSAVFNKDTIDAMSAYLKEQNFPRTYRQLEIANNQSQILLLMKFAMILLVATQAHPLLYSESSPLQERQIQLLNSIKNLDYVSFKESVHVVLPSRAQDENLGDAHIYYSIGLVLLGMALGFTALNKSRNFFAQFFQQQEPLKQNFLDLDSEIQQCFPQQPELS